MGFSLRLRLDLTQKLVLSLPVTSWSLVKAIEEEGEEPLRFEKKHLDTSRMSLTERLEAVDEANEVFRFEYGVAKGRDCNGKETRGYYKVPLMRDFTVEVDETKIKITKKEYEQATVILGGAGRFQRIARAVPYCELNRKVISFVEEQGFSLDDVVVVGVDRGGRLPSYILREALGTQEGYTLKVDQSNGRDGDLDREKLDELIEMRVLQDRFVLFVDSTVDSGRQIEVLRRYFNNEEWQKRIAHRGWGVVGSNENGFDHYKHRNINWGLDPDVSFEDDPVLMGVDYASRWDLTKVRECPSHTSERIKNALLEVPRGVVLDLSNLEKVLEIKKAYSQITKSLDSQGWQQAQMKSCRLPKLDCEIETIERDEKKRLLVIGSSKEVDLNEGQVGYLVNGLVGAYDLIAGTPKGNPGLLLTEFSLAREGSCQLYQPRYRSDQGACKEQFGSFVNFHGEIKKEFRENLVQSCDAVLVLGGGEGTLREVILSAYAGKEMYVIKDYGAVGAYMNKSRFWRKFESVHLVEGLVEAVEGLVTL